MRRGSLWKREVRLTSFFGLLITLLLAPYTAVAQQDGVPNFGAADVHDNDVINLQTLIPAINIPVAYKSEAIPLEITLTAQQYCYTFSNVPSGTYIRECSGEFGAYASGLLNATFTYSKKEPVGGNCPNGGTATSYSGWYLLTSDGLDAHPINVNTALVLNDPAHSGIPQGNCTATYSINAITVDGSGYTVHLSIPSGTLSNWLGLNSTDTFSVVAKDGSSINGLYNPTATITDTFGNTSSSTASGLTRSYTDSLGVASTATTTITGDRPTSQNGSVTYLDTNANTQTITLQRSTTLYETYIAGTCKGAGQGFSIYPLKSINFPDTTSMSFTYEVGGLPNTLTGRISSYTTRQGGTISYQYAAACGSALTNSLTRTTPDGETTYSSSLSGNQYGTNNWVTTVLDPGNNKIVYTFGSTTYPNPAIGILTEKDIYQNTGTVSSPVYSLLSKDVYCYNTNQTNCTGAPVSYPITQRDIYHYVGANSVAMSHATQTYDTYGNTTSSAAYDYITGQTLTTTTTYSGCGQGATINDRPCDTKVVNGSNTLSETKFTYKSNGALLTRSLWTGSTWLTTTYTPNSNGTIGSIQDPNGQVVSLDYAATGAGGCNGLLPTSLTTTINGVQINSSQTWNCDAGVMLTTTDPNGHGTKATYDTMLRPNSYSDESQFQTTFGYTRNSVSSSASFGSSVLNDTDYLDGLDRPIVSQTQQGPNSLDYDTTSATYAFSGPNRQVKTSSAPCMQTIDQPCSTYDTTILDPLGRPISSLDGLGGTVAYTYTQNDVSVSVGPPPAGEHYKTLQTEVDGFSRTKSVCALQSSGGTACGQVMGNAGVLTSYGYSFGAGSTTVTATRGVQTHTTVSDALGRVVTSTTPEHGITTYTYDTVAANYCALATAYTSAGNLVAVADANGNHVCYYYDLLHRLTDVGNNVQSTVNACKRFRYDSAVNGVVAAPPGYVGNNLVGRLVEAETDFGSMITDEWFAYDNNGRMTDVWEYTPKSKVYYHTTVLYYPNGTPNTLSGLPGYPTLTYGLDGEGWWKTATLGTTTVVSSVTPSPLGPTAANVGAGTDQDTYSYNALGEMSQYQFFVGSQNNKGVLNWNANGTLGSLQITDGFNPADTQTCQFGYDDVERITGDNCGSVWSQTYSYDQYDNLTKSGNASFACTGCYNPANNQFQTLGATYDADGNLTYDGSANHYTWDGYGKMATANGIAVTYDAFREPVAGPSGEILYTPLGKVGVLANSTTFGNAYVPLPGGGAMSLGCCSNNIWYLHRDWVESARVTSTVPASGNGSFTNDRSFSPYGDVYQNSGSNPPLSFAGVNSDLFATSGTGSPLYDTLNRELALNASRWISPDPAGASWNAYSYPTDPNTQTDPTGLCSEQGGGSEDGGGGECSGFAGGDDNFWQDSTNLAAGGDAPQPAAKCEGWLCWLIALFGGGSSGGNQPNNPGPSQGHEPIEAGWDRAVDAVAAETAGARAGLNTATQNAKKGIDWYNAWLGFAPTNCAKGGDCFNALGMAGTSVFVAIDSFGASEEANGAKAIKQLKEAPAAVDFLRNELLAQAKDPALRDAIDNLFRATAKIGDGGSMAAYRDEVQRGLTGKGRVHWEKLITRRTQLMRIYRSGRLGASDRAITYFLMKSIQEALSTRPPI
jgi:RHS repeat-associated protein